VSITEEAAPGRCASQPRLTGFANDHLEEGNMMYFIGFPDKDPQELGFAF
jgi:hypothetical protein